MEVYLIRHGETGGNVAHRHQSEKTRLTKQGVEQARMVAEKVKDLEPTHLLTSPVIRALETAREIGEVCNLVPETNTNFSELKRPEHMYGHYHTSLRSMMFYSGWFIGRSKQGESYEALRQRIIFAKDHFKDYPEDARVAVVSHSVFINLFLAHLCQDDSMGPLTALKTFINVMSMKNTEFVPLIFNPNADKGACGWLRVDD